MIDKDTNIALKFITWCWHYKVAEPILALCVVTKLLGSHLLQVYFLARSCLAVDIT